ncbi:MAG TPA: FliA/WhiG family RNA polymerase sigma factor [Terriglobales bacterium]|nr:FliA/WhiG family RNA polymerase sigma factor [Terriglobales bacterium]
MNELNDTLWARYRGEGDPGARSELLDRYIGLVHHTARELAKRVSRGIELDELISAGTVGLVQALEGFDPARGAAFSSNAMPRIRGAMLDELRAQDWMPRAARSRQRQIAAARDELRQRLGRAPRDAEVAESMGVDLRTFWRWAEQSEGRVVLALDAPAAAHEYGPASLAESIADVESPAPGDELSREETLDALHDAFAALPEKDRLVLSLYYYERLNLREIGEVLHVGESRVSQIRTRALRRLRRGLEEMGGAP